VVKETGTREEEEVDHPRKCGKKLSEEKNIKKGEKFLRGRMMMMMMMTTTTTHSSSEVKEARKGEILIIIIIILHRIHAKSWKKKGE